MAPMPDSNFSREVEGGGGLRKMLSCLGGAEIRGSVWMVILCCGGAVAGVGFWYSAMRLLMLRMLSRQSVMI